MKIRWYYFLFIPLITAGVVFFLQNKSKSQVYAEGGIEVTALNPLFDISNFKPGQNTGGRITVKNVSSEEQRVGLRFTTGRRTDIAFAGKLSLQVKDATNSAIIFGDTAGKKLSTLFLTASDNFLFNLLPNQSRELDLVLTFDPSATDFFQDRSLIFDFSFGFIARPQTIRIPTIRLRR